MFHHYQHTSQLANVLIYSKTFTLYISDDYSLLPLPINQLKE